MGQRRSRERAGTLIHLKNVRGPFSGTYRMEWKTAGEAMPASPGSAAPWAPGTATRSLGLSDGKATWEWAEVWPPGGAGTQGLETGRGAGWRGYPGDPANEAPAGSRSRDRQGGADCPKGPLPRAEPLCTAPSPLVFGAFLKVSWWLVVPRGKREGHLSRSCPGLDVWCRLRSASKAWPFVPLFSFWLRAGSRTPSVCLSWRGHWLQLRAPLQAWAGP